MPAEIEKKYTDKDFLKIIDIAVAKAVEQVKPVDCNLHANTLASLMSHAGDLQKDIDDMAKLLGQAIRGGQERSDIIKGIHDALYVSEDDKKICVTEKIRTIDKSIKDVDQKLDNHIDNHKAVVSNWKFWIPLAISCASSLVIAVWVLAKQMQMHKVDKVYIREIISTVLEEQK